MISPDTTSIISVDCYLWGLLTAFHQTSQQLVTSRSQSHLGHSSQRLGLVHLRLGSRLGLGRKGLVHIPGRIITHNTFNYCSSRKAEYTLLHFLFMIIMPLRTQLLLLS